MVEIKLNGVKQKFKVDTGAYVTVVPESMYDQKRDGELLSSSVPLKGPTDENLEVCGQFVGNLSRNGISSQQTIYVVQNLR